MAKLKYFIAFCILSTMVVGYMNCGSAIFQGTDPGTSSSGTTIGEPLAVFVTAPFQSKNPNFSVEFCRTAIDIFDDAGNKSTLASDFVLGSFRPSGGSFSEINAPLYEYQEFFIKVGDQCGQGFSVRVRNVNGVFQVSQSASFWFLQLPPLIHKPSRIELDFSDFVSHFENIQSDIEIIEVLDQYRGRFVTE